MSNLDSNCVLQGTLSKREMNNSSLPIRVEVIFGVPGQSCNGVGICKIIPTEHVRVNWACPNVRAQIRVMPFGVLCMTIERKLLSTEYCERYFTDNVFHVVEPYSLPKSVLTMLNLETFTVDAGAYSVIVSEHFFEIYFISC